MSEADKRPELDLQQVVAQIDRAQAETRKFVEESFKLMAEQRKLSAEADKLQCDRWIAPWTLVAAVTAAILAALPTLRLLLGR